MNVINEKPNFTPNPTTNIVNMKNHVILHTIELRLTDQEYQRVRLIAASMNTTPAKFYRAEVKELINSGLFDEMLTGHDCHWVG